MIASGKESVKLEELLKQLPDIYDCSDKKLNFAVSDSGEFLDNVYRESISSFLLGVFMGRSHAPESSANHKKYFSAADVIIAGDLYKCGSWFKTWKQRYFVLRKDIRALCYFESKENLKLLGTIPLSTNTCVMSVRPENADGYKNVLEIQPWGLQDPGRAMIRIRADTPEKIKIWENEIINEATSTKEIVPDNNGDWLSNLIDERRIPEFNGLSNAKKRRGLNTPAQINQKLKESKSPDIPPPPAIMSSPIENAVDIPQEAPMPDLGTREDEDNGDAAQFDDENTDDEDESEEKNNIALELLNSTESSKKEIIVLNDDEMLPTQSSFHLQSTLSEPYIKHSPIENSHIESLSDSSRSDKSPTIHHQLDKHQAILSHLTIVAQRNLLKIHSGAEDELAAIRKFVLNQRTAIFNRKYKLNSILKKIKPEKHSEPSPYRHPRIERFEESGKISGAQITVELGHVCGAHDRIFAAVFCCSNSRDELNPNSGQWRQVSITEVVTVTDSPSYGAAFIDSVRIHFSLLQEPLPKDCAFVMISVYRCDTSEMVHTDILTKVRSDRNKNNNANNNSPITLDDPGVGYRQKHLQNQKAIARVMLKIRDWNSEPIFFSQMKVLLESSVDLSNPQTSSPFAYLYVIKMTSGSLLNHRLKLMESFKGLPYAEMMYSFQTTTGQTLSIEQLYGSSYAVTVPEAMIKFIQLDRGSSISKLLVTAYKHLDVITAEIDELGMHVATGTHTPSAGSNSNGQPLSRHSITMLTHAENFSSSSVENQYLNSLLLGQELLRQAAEVITDVQAEFHNSFVVISENCQNCRIPSSQETSKKQRGRPTSPVRSNTNVEDSSRFLRKSIWKKIPQWQYSSTNLNVHMMISRHFTVDEIAVPKLGHTSLGSAIRPPSKSSSSGIHVIPTITLGCPAAHSLRFKEGGLRRLFEDIISPESKLLWLHMIQSDIPLSDFLSFLSESNKEANSLFGSTNIPQSVLQLTSWQLELLNGIQPSSNEHFDGPGHLIREIYTMHRKLEIAQRIDIVSSQVLAFAITYVRTIIMLATTAGGSFVDVLQRSIKIGFLVSVESLLTSYRDELGMIEDLDVAILWLSLVTMRFVSVGKNPQQNTRLSTVGTTTGSRESPKRPSTDDKVVMGASTGVTIRRDTTGRIIVDLELPQAEVETVKSCLVYMATCPVDHVDYLTKDNDSSPIRKKYASALKFNPNPIVPYADNELEPEIHAVVQLYGVMFTQGVNEVQTLAILTQSRDMHRQSDINLQQAYRNMTQPPTLREQMFKTSRNDMSFTQSVKSISTKPLGRLNRSLSMNLRKSTNTGNDADATNSAEDYGLFMSPSSDLESLLEFLFHKAIQSYVKVFEETQFAVQKASHNPMDKHVDVLLKFSALCRKIGGTIGILCKSGKDRTGMGVTLETTRSLVEDLGVRCSQDVCNILRTHGVRRMNVYMNTGQSKFAFNKIQRAALPGCYRPPVGTHGGNVAS